MHFPFECRCVRHASMTKRLVGDFNIPVGEDGSFEFRTVVPALSDKGQHEGTISITLGKFKCQGTYTYDGNESGFITVSGNVNHAV